MDEENTLLETTASMNGFTSPADPYLTQSQSEYDGDIEKVRKMKTLNEDKLLLSDPLFETSTLDNAATTSAHLTSPATLRELYEITPPSPTWMMPISKLTNCRKGKHGCKFDENGNRRSEAVRKFYQRQDELINDFEKVYKEIIMGPPSGMSPSPERDENGQVLLVDAEQVMAGKLAKLSFVSNLILLIAKVIAAAMSGALAIISSLIDSAVDFCSGVIVWITSRAMRKRSPYRYPGGRTRLEPVAIVVLSVIMAVASVQIIIQAFEKIGQFAAENSQKEIITGSDGKNGTLSTPLHWSTRLNIPVLCLIGASVVIKIILYIICKKFGSTPSVEALCQDHRNDVLTNSVVLCSTIFSTAIWIFADPIAAILIGIYIIYSWTKTCWEQTKALTGYTADPAFLQIITYVAANHHHDILQIDTVRAFHHGTDYLVEVDIVLPEEMSVKHAHDIAETLQHKIERLDSVERAFVHIDYEVSHDPWKEHKQV